MVAFFTAVLGAEEGFRPPFGSPGHWVYVDGVPAIHLDVVKREADFPKGIVNHIAFGVYEFEATKARIETAGYPYRITGIPGTEIGQFFVDGPEGLLLEVQFRRLSGS
ncbi:MAG: glyoxalase [Devosia sp.]|nr:glyoxalase [Devosia sp.]